MRCAHCANVIRCTLLEIKLGWGKKQVDHLDERPSDADGIWADVYVVGDAKGNEIVLKLHRYVCTCSPRRDRA